MTSLKFSRFFLLLLHTTVHGQRTSTFVVSSIGTSFQPANMIELLDLFNAETQMDCFHRCNRNVLCRTVDYDSNSKQCRHFEGEVSTGTIITSNSSFSQVAAIEFSSDQYASYNQTDSRCELNRYLVIDKISNLCVCPLNTFWNGSMCLNQLYNGSSCQTADWCRMSLNLICDPIAQRCVGINITTTTTTTGIPTTTPVINYNGTFPAPIASPNAAAESPFCFSTIFNEYEYCLFLVYGVNLLINGDAETGPCDTNGTIASPTNWSSINAVQMAYNNSALADVTLNTTGPR